MIEGYENILLNYGVLGLWTLVLLVDKMKNQKENKELIQNNTIAITKVYEVMAHCQNRNI